jgi:hypothetical protein
LAASRIKTNERVTLKGKNRMASRDLGLKLP